MRFLVDNALSGSVSRTLNAHGHDALHVRDVGLQDADDSTVIARAELERRVLISADTDFGTILALRRSRSPSFVLFRGEGTRNPRAQAQLLLSNLANIEPALNRGAVVVFEATRIRIRDLPIGG